MTMRNRSSPLKGGGGSKNTSTGGGGETIVNIPETSNSGPSNITRRRTFEKTNFRLLAVADEEIHEEKIIAADSWTGLKIVRVAFLVLFISSFIITFNNDDGMNVKLFGLKLWKLEVMGFVLICGKVIGNWVMYGSVVVIQKCFLKTYKLIDFCFGIKDVVAYVIWFVAILITWLLLSTQSHISVENFVRDQAPKYVTRTCWCFLVGSFICLVKTYLVKLLESNYHVNSYLTKIHECLCDPDDVGKSIEFDVDGGQGVYS